MKCESCNTEIDNDSLLQYCNECFDSFMEMLDKEFNNKIGGNGGMKYDI